ncbi:hypothetical protein [Sinomonas sp.]|uniref:hypothetical protein n=1 Tax=Sinomonas sp. TaxID=1914986 RepID=UPI002FE2DFE8
MNGQPLTKVMLWAAVVVAGFNALSGIAGGLAMMVTNGLGMPRSFLEHSPFDSFLLPGLILLAVVGGTQATAFAQLIRRAASGLLWNAVAGFGMVIWISVELMMIRQFTWLQVLYLATGLLQLALTFGFLGITSWFPPLEPERSASSSHADPRRASRRRTA